MTPILKKKEEVPPTEQILEELDGLVDTMKSTLGRLREYYEQEQETEGSDNGGTE